MKYESSMINAECIDRFTGDYVWLSNFFTEPSGTTVEHRFQAAKARHNPELRGDILNAKTPGIAKRLGRKVPLDRKWWAKECGPVMYQALLTKFFDPVLREKLLATGNSVLIEGNYWHDNYWGNCMCNSEKCQPLGHNHLGMMLMEVRTHYRSYQSMVDGEVIIEDADIDGMPYQICGEPDCDANTEGNRPYCGEHTDIDGAQLAHDEQEERDEQESGYRSGKGE